MSTSRTSYQPAFDTESEPTVPAWKAELNAKLAAHRERHPAATAYDAAGESHPQPVTRARVAPRLREGESPARSSLVAARVAERYAKAPSYSEFLAASAAAAAAAAETAAFASRQAQEAAEALARLTAAEAARDLASAREQSLKDAREAAEAVLVANDLANSMANAGQSAPGMHPVAASVEWRPTVEHPAPLPTRGVVPPRPPAGSRGLFGHAGGFIDAFAEAVVPAAIGLPAKLIEFPRELIAAHKSRPRIAEGPLADGRLFEETAAPSLRIFEVASQDAMPTGPLRSDLEPGAGVAETPLPAHPDDGGYRRGMDQRPQQDESTPSTYAAREAQREEAAPRASVWQSIRLGEHPSADCEALHLDSKRAGSTPPQSAPVTQQAASIGDRTMAALVDGCLVLGAFMLFVLVFASCTAHLPVTKAALVCAVALLGALLLFYEWLFMSYGTGTPGMRYARIALCTFDDENLTRAMMRKRVAASVLSALALGLGFLWALFDEDSLTWHDRMTRSYQRSCL